MKNRHRTDRVLFLCLIGVLAASAPGLAQAKKAPRKSAPDAAGSSAPAAPPKVDVVADWVLDRRTTSDFPGPELAITFKLQGDDAAAVQSARARVTKAVDDTGKNLVEPSGSSTMRGDGWQKGDGGPPKPRISLASPARKAKSLAALEGVLETYLPSRDPGATVKIDRVTSKKDKPALAIPALASQRIRLQVLSKAGLENEKKQAEAKKKAQDAKKQGAKKEGVEAMADAMGDALVNTLESLFMNAGDNDLILKVDDPGKKIFAFDLAGSDGAPIQSYGTTDVESYRIVRMLQPIPEGAVLMVRLKTAKSFGESPFALANVKLP